jgi:hypothetical protein
VPDPCPPVSVRTPGPRSACAKSSTTTTTTPISSRVTPAELITAITRTPITLMTVVRASTTTPSRTAFAAPSAETGEESLPTNWNPDQIGGRTICIAIAATAVVTICAMIMIQPANQPTVTFETRLDH